MKLSSAFSAALLGLAGGGAFAAEGPAPTSRLIGHFDITQGGQPILLPQGPAQVSASETTIPAGGAIAAHKHPHQRLVYILEGRIRVTNLDTGAAVELKAGELGVEARDQWHEGEALGEGPVRMLVIDQTPPAQGNVVRRAK